MVIEMSISSSASFDIRERLSASIPQSIMQTRQFEQRLQELALDLRPFLSNQVFYILQQQIIRLFLP